MITMIHGGFEVPTVTTTMGNDLLQLWYEVFFDKPIHNILGSPGLL